MIDTAAAVAINASAKAANAAEQDNARAIAPVANGRGRRVSALNSYAEASPTAVSAVADARPARSHMGR